MRKAAAMIGFGAFFLTLALLMRFYAYPKLAVMPSDLNTQQVVTDNNAKYFDATKIKSGSGRIETRDVVVSDQDAAKKASREVGHKVMVVNQWQTTNNFDGSKKVQPPMSAFTQTVAVNPSTGAAESWSGNTMDGKQATITGQILKFPFQTQKDNSYQYFDSTLDKAFPVRYAGTDKVRGLTTYKFTQSIPKTKFTTMQVPPTIFQGLPNGPGVTANRFYSNDRTLWVEPETGVIMKLEEKQHQTLEVPNAQPVDAVKTTSLMDDNTIKNNVDEYKSKASQLKILRLWAPLFLGLIGLAAILLGLLVSLRAGRGRLQRHYREQEERREQYDHEHYGDEHSRDHYRDGDETREMPRSTGGSHSLDDGQAY